MHFSRVLSIDELTRAVDFASIDPGYTDWSRCWDTCEPSVEHLALDSRGKSVATKKIHARPWCAVRRSISGALIGGGKAGKRYITVWHDGAPWSAIYWERTRLKPMINEPAWPRRKRSESGMTFRRFLPAYRFRYTPFSAARLESLALGDRN